VHSIPRGHPPAADIAGFDLTLRAAGRAAKTRRTYRDAASWLAWHVSRDRAVTGWADVSRTHIREHFASLAGEYSAAYASNQHRALQAFGKCLADEYGVANPMAGMKPPRVPPKLVPVISAQHLDRLLAVCSGRGSTRCGTPR